MRIDLNSDVGESFGERVMGDDEAVIPLLSSANLACGEHGGDPATMRRALELCAEHGTRVGAHFSYPDRAGFGRHPMSRTPVELRADLLRQFEKLSAAADPVGVRVQYAKPHGALYNLAAVDRDVAETLVATILEFRPDWALMCPAASAMAVAAADCGIEVVSEGFADRAYLPSGALVPRSEPGAVHTDPAIAAEQALRLAQVGRVRCSDGTEIEVPAKSICVHSDTPGAVAALQAIRELFERHQIAISA